MKNVLYYLIHNFRRINFMDVFKEYIVKRELSQGEKTSKIFTIAAAVALAAFFILLTFNTTLTLFGFVFAGLSIFIGYQLITKLFVEYEYILTNADLDIDKIVNQAKRNRLCTIDLHKVSEYGVVNGDFAVGEDETLVKAGANNPELTDYYLRFTHREFGKGVLVFTPSTEMTQLMKPFFPRNAVSKL